MPSSTLHCIYVSITYSLCWKSLSPWSLSLTGSPQGCPVTLSVSQETWNADKDRGSLSANKFLHFYNINHSWLIYFCIWLLISHEHECFSSGPFSNSVMSASTLIYNILPFLIHSAVINQKSIFYNEQLYNCGRRNGFANSKDKLPQI